MGSRSSSKIMGLVFLVVVLIIVFLPLSGAMKTIGLGSSLAVVGLVTLNGKHRLGSLIIAGGLITMGILRLYYKETVLLGPIETIIVMWVFILSFIVYAPHSD